MSMRLVRLSWAKLCARSPFIDRVFSAPFVKMRRLRRDFLSRRPHRTFRRTLRRDYRRSLQIPGYWKFTFYVFATLGRWKKPFLALATVYAVLSAVIVGIGSQNTFNQLADLVISADIFEGGWGHIQQAGVLFFGTLTSSISNPNPNGGQGVFGFFLVLMLWLTVVWLLRAFLAGKSPRLRDGLYNAGSPIVAMALVTLFGLVQLMPAVLGMFIATAVVSLSGVLSMLLWLLFAALMTLSLYWLTSTFFAMIIVTLPGMYPWRALRTAGDLVVGRRVRILMRLLWAAGVVIVVWLAIMIPLILFDIWIGSFVSWFKLIPVIPVSLLILSSVTMIWLAAYIYLFYRKVVDDDAAPA